MKIHFLKEDALIALKANIPANLAKYKLPTNGWIYDYFSGEDPFMEATIECDDFQLVTGSSEKSASLIDAMNTRILYAALRHLTETQATDERLWAGLCHYDLWDFCNKRWQKEAEEKLTPQLVHNRYFISNSFSKKRGLATNTLSKLWWLGRWTYDPHRSDPFELVKFFETEFYGKLLLIFSNNYMSNYEIAAGLIEALLHLDNIGYSLTQVYNPKNSPRREIFLKATGYLNVLGGTHILDLYTKEEIKNRVLDYMFSLPHTSNEGSLGQTKAVIQPEIRKPPAPTVKMNDANAPGQPEKPSAPQPAPSRQRRSVSYQAEEKHPTEIDERIITYCQTMRMSYSYKALLILALLNHLEPDGKMPITKAVSYFKTFFRTRVSAGLPAELKPSIYSDLGVPDNKTLSHIMRIPMNALILSGLFEYDQQTKRFGFHHDLWPRMTSQGCQMIADVTKARINEYYRDSMSKNSSSIHGASRNAQRASKDPNDYAGMRVFHTTQKAYATVIDYDGTYFVLQFISGENAGKCVRVNAALCMKNNLLEIVE